MFHDKYNKIYSSVMCLVVCEGHEKGAKNLLWVYVLCFVKKSTRKLFYDYCAAIQREAQFLLKWRIIRVHYIR